MYIVGKKLLGNNGFSFLLLLEIYPQSLQLHTTLTSVSLFTYKHTECMMLSREKKNLSLTRSHLNSIEKSWQLFLPRGYCCELYAWITHFTRHCFAEKNRHAHRRIHHKMYPVQGQMVSWSHLEMNAVHKHGLCALAAVLKTLIELVY